MTSEKQDRAVFGGGCFWCTEAIFQRVRGVQKVTSGYAGGERPHPTYEQVSSEATGHAEVIEILFDPAQITYPELLEIFWEVHDPTTLNRQGADVGTQYRSVIFTTTSEQQQQAEAALQALQKSGKYPNPVVTEIRSLTTFYPADESHQNYFVSHKDQPYCQVVIAPKLDKFLKKYPQKTQ